MSDSEIIRRRTLPHWDVPNASYFITTCLEGSIPAKGLLDLKSYRDQLARCPRPQGMAMYEWTLRQWKLNFSRIDRWLDESKGCRFLEDKRLAEVVVEALFHFAGKRYDLLGFVVMPSHLHWVFRPLKEWVKKLQPGIRVRTPRERIIHSINRWTAARCNQLLKRSGEFWQHECYDHWVRSAEEMQRILEYIDDNPVKAGLVPFPEEWLWSSAWYRTKRGLKVGEPLMRIEPAS